MQKITSYRVELTTNAENFTPGKPANIIYKILDNNGQVLKDFEVSHEKIMHLIVVRKDLQDFQHLHPDFNPTTGEFTSNILFPNNGPYRIFPDFTPASDNLEKLPITLSYDLMVGDVSKYQPQKARLDTHTFKAVDGYKVSYTFPKTIKAKTQVNYSLKVEKEDKVARLESYLGARGHSVIIREDSLDFIHTHPQVGEGTDGGHNTGEHTTSGDSIDFRTTFPEAGIYRVYTQFQMDRHVITSDYTVQVQ
ncbi:MAG TPA: hypothetical protein VEA59_06315 [Patescibacteria group bacterium]|nr:hypothetical protein [Patescibacteria group bacterium]